MSQSTNSVVLRHGGFVDGSRCQHVYVGRVLDHLAAPAPLRFGHSPGGLVAQRYALVHAFATAVAGFAEHCSTLAPAPI